MMDKTLDEQYREAKLAYRATLERYHEIPEHLPNGTEKPHIIPVPLDDLDRDRLPSAAIVLLKRLTGIVERHILDLDRLYRV